MPRSCGAIITKGDIPALLYIGKHSVFAQEENSGKIHEEDAALADLTVKYPADVCFIELMPMGEQGEFRQNAMIPCQQILMRFPNLHHGR